MTVTLAVVNAKRRENGVPPLAHLPRATAGEWLTTMLRLCVEGHCDCNNDGDEEFQQ